MALLVWLPLNGDLRNLGLSNYSFLTDGATVDNNGKIGKCYYLNLKVLYNTDFDLPTTSSSVCMWVKFTAFPSSSNAYVFTVNGKSSSDYQTMFGIYSNNATTAVLRYNLGNDIGTLNLNTWYHLCYTYDGSTVNLYIDGELKKSANLAVKTARKHLVIGGRSNNSSGTEFIGVGAPAYYNDIRVYDHCLSPKEVKEISKGLVLHYKLDDISFESTTNLCTYSTTYENVNEGLEYTVSKWGGDDGTITYYRSGGYNNGPYKVYHKTATGTGGIFRKLGEDIHIISGKTYTMSIYVRASRNLTDSTHAFNINRNAATLYSSGNRYITYNKSISFTTEWQRISRTFTATDADAGNYGEMSIVYNDDVEDYYVYYSCFQIEESSYATEYVNGSRNPKIIDNLFSYSNLEGHGSSWVLQSETFYGHPIYKNVVTSPDTGNNAGFRIHSSITHSLLSLVTKITISFYKRLNVVYGKNLGGYVQVTKSDDTTTNYSWSYNKSDWANDSNSIGVWDYITATVTIPIGCKLINLLYVYTDRAPSGDCDFTAILLELSSSATPINNLLSKYIILTDNICLDYSGYNNNGTITGQLSVNSDTSRYNYSTVFNGMNSCVTIPYKTVNPSGVFTVNLWFKKDIWGAKGFETLFGGPSGFEMDTRSSTSTTLMIYMASTRGGKRNLITTMSLGNWYMITMTRDDEKERYYVNGIFQSEIESKPMPNGNYFIGAWYNITRLNYLGLISDFRLYATVLSEEDIKELYNTSAIVDNLGNIYGYLFEENGEINILSDQNLGIINKLWVSGLSKYTQTNCLCTLTDDGYRIYRPANLTPSDNGNTMWGGFVLSNADNRFGLQDNHTYIIEFDVKGQSSNAAASSWSNNVGWSGGGLIPNPTDVVEGNPVGSNFNSTEWKHYFYKFKISDGLYKTCTSAYSSFVVGNTYISYKEFKFGYNYAATGTLGTDIYIKNLTMHDITNDVDNNVNITKTGIVNVSNFLEENSLVQFSYSGTVNSNQLIEI